MKTIGGFLCLRNADSLDYCWREAIQSLLPICDQICVSESESTDGTREALNEWAGSEPKLKIRDFKWPDPKGDPKFYPGWMNHARAGLKTDYAITLDADEILCPSSYDRIRRAAERGESLMCKRINFWRDAQSLIPVGQCCGTNVIRAGQQRHFFPSDYPDIRASEIQSKAIPAPEVVFYHYGFLRERDAFFRKARAVSRIWAGADNFDPRLEQAEKEDGNWMVNHRVSEWIHMLQPFMGQHPEIIKPWLRERGYWLDGKDLMFKWQDVVNGSRHVFSWTGDHEASFLAEIASRAEYGLEIGSYMGFSAKVMLDANPKLHLWCADTFGVAGTMECCQYFLRDHIASGRCELIKGTVNDAAGMLEHMRGKLDFAFSDDGHLQEHVENDIQSIYPLIKLGGTMIGHDYETPANGVTLAVQKLLPNHFEPVARIWQVYKDKEL